MYRYIHVYAYMKHYPDRVYGPCKRFLQPIGGGGRIMASLSNILREAGVQDTFIDKLSDDGWTIELFSMAAPTMDKFDDELKEILGDLFDITTAVQRSALRFLVSVSIFSGTTINSGGTTSPTYWRRGDGSI